MPRRNQMELLEGLVAPFVKVRNFFKALEPREITPEMRERFARCAPAALKRRSPAYLNGILLDTVQMLVLGAIGLAGLYLWRWSPLTLFVMMLAGMFAGILVCTLRWLVARRALLAQVERHNEDRFVWALVGALRQGQTEVESGNLVRYRAGVGVFADWLLGTLALLVFAYVLLRMGIHSPAQFFASRELQWAVLAAVALPLVQGLMAIWSWRDPEGTALENFGAGVYGTIALILTAIFAFTIESPDALRKLMVGINVAAIVLGGFALIGCKVLRNEAEWLRTHLREYSRPGS